MAKSGRSRTKTSQARAPRQPKAAPVTALAAVRPAAVRADEQAKADGWQNVLTGLGTAQDKRSQSKIVYERLCEIEAEELFCGDDVAAKIVTTLPSDALRQGVRYKSDTEGVVALLEKAIDGLHFWPNCKVAWEYARIYGGAALLMNVDDGALLEEPLNIDAIRQIKSFTPLTRWELQATDIDPDLESTMYGKPLAYVFQPARASMAATMGKIHHTRLLIFSGSPLPVRQYISNGHWDDSVLTRIKNPLSNYQTVNDAVTVIMQEFNQGVFSLKQLADMLKSGRDGEVIKRLTMVQMAKSVCRAVVIDSEEKYEMVSASLTGVPEVMDRVESRLVVASNMPHTKLLGKSPSGLGATGQSEENNWNDFVSNEQELVLRPKLELVLLVLMKSRKGPTNGRLIDDVTFEFTPLEQPNENEIVSARSQQAQTDKIYIEAGVVTPKDVATSRFANGGRYSYETTVTEQPGQNLPRPTPEPAPVPPAKT